MAKEEKYNPTPDSHMSGGEAHEEAKLQELWKQGIGVVEVVPRGDKFRLIQKNNPWGEYATHKTHNEVDEFDTEEAARKYARGMRDLRLIDEIE